MNTPSSRSLSYTTIVPSACETRNNVDDDGTHRTAVHGEFVMQPFQYSLGWLQVDGVLQRTCLFKRAYRDVTGSEKPYVGRHIH